MPTEINHNSVKQQMVDILQNNTNLYDVNVIDGSRITYIEVGEPSQVLKSGSGLPIPPTYPGLWITNSRPLETIKPTGTITDTSHTALIHDVDYDIKFMVNEQDSIIAEKVLDNLQQVILETLEDDIRFDNDIWSSSTTYSTDDKVSYKGGLYQSESNNNTGNIPDAGSPWIFLTRLPADSWPSRVDTFRQNQDGSEVRGKTITWKCKIFT